MTMKGGGARDRFKRVNNECVKRWDGDLTNDECIITCTTPILPPLILPKVR